MESHFFIPASKIHKLDSVPDNCIKIIDLEDSVLQAEFDAYFSKIKQLNNNKNYWYRIALRDDFQESLNLKIFKDLSSIGLNKFILPKLKTLKELKLIQKLNAKANFMLLVEHPLLLMQLDRILANKEIRKKIVALGVGSHDYLTFIDSNQNTENFNFLRLKLLHAAKAYGLKSIDFASMNLKDKTKFTKYLDNGFNLGFDAKFIIHPKQQKWLESFSLLQHNKQLQWAKNIMSYLPEGSTANIEPIIIEGQIIEKPHIKKALKILANEDK